MYTYCNPISFISVYCFTLFYAFIVHDSVHTLTCFTLFDRLRYLGFDIVDLGCCKCIRHPLWGAFTFVGTIFTSAPSSSPAIQTIMEI